MGSASVCLTAILNDVSIESGESGENHAVKTAPTVLYKLILLDLTILVRVRLFQRLLSLVVEPVTTLDSLAEQVTLKEHADDIVPEEDPISYPVGLIKFPSSFLHMGFADLLNLFTFIIVKVGEDLLVGSLTL